MNFIMKFFKYCRYSLFVLEFISSCSKTGYVVTTAPVSTFNVVNAMPSSNPIIINSSENIYVTGNYSMPQINYESSFAYSIASGNSVIGIFQTSDSGKSIFTTLIQFAPNKVYSLFLSGINSSNPDTLTTLDSIPYYGSDSLTGVRFVNLCSGSQPMSVNIAGNPPNQIEFSGLAYKNLSAFKAYAATSNIGGFYNFEIRDQVSDSLLTTFVFNFLPFRSYTLVMSGSEGLVNPSPIMAFQVNNF
jgi:hypothetical protein